MNLPSDSFDLLLLLGPNGVGKTTIGRCLAQQHLCTFMGIEQFFLRHYPNLEDLSNNMQKASRDFKKQLTAAIHQSSHPIIFEETGVNPTLFEMIQELSEEYKMLIVHVTAPSSVCEERVKSRGIENNYPKSSQFVVQKRNAFFEQVLPSLPIDFEVCNNGPMETVLSPFTDLLSRRISQ